MDVEQDLAVPRGRADDLGHRPDRGAVGAVQPLLVEQGVQLVQERCGQSGVVRLVHLGQDLGADLGRAAVEVVDVRREEQLVHELAGLVVLHADRAQQQGRAAERQVGVERHEHLGRALRAADDHHPGRLVGRPPGDPGGVLGAVDHPVGRQAVEDLRYAGVPAGADDQVAAVHGVAVGQPRGPADERAVLLPARRELLDPGVAADAHVLQGAGHPLEVVRYLLAVRVEGAHVHELVQPSPAGQEAEEGEPALRVAQRHQVLEEGDLAARPRQQQVALPLHVRVLLQHQGALGQPLVARLLDGHGQRQVRRAGPDGQDLHFAVRHTFSDLRCDNSRRWRGAAVREGRFPDPPVDFVIRCPQSIRWGY